MYCGLQYIVVECTFGELVDLLNLDSPLEDAWILEDINLIYENFHYVSFVSVPWWMWWNRATLAIVIAAKENKEAWRMSFFSLSYCQPDSE